MKHMLFFMVLVGLSSCKTSDQQDPMVRTRLDDPLEDSIHEAISEANAGHTRGVAQAESVMSVVNPRLQSLRGSFVVVLFPKKNDMTEKSRRLVPENAANDPHGDFGKPVAFRITAQGLDQCAKLVKWDNRKLAHKLFFASLKDQKDLGCGVFNIELEKKPNKGLIHDGDLLSTRIYIDSQYRPYGVENLLFSGRRNAPKPTMMAIDPDTALQSGLWMLPIDLPALTKLRPGRSPAGEVSIGPIAVPSNKFLRRRVGEIQNRASTFCQSAVRMRYRDEYGGLVLASWCPGSPWPAAVETNRYFAVLASVPSGN